MQTETLEILQKKRQSSIVANSSVYLGKVMKYLEELIREAIIESCDRFGHSIPTEDIDEIAKEKVDELREYIDHNTEDCEKFTVLNVGEFTYWKREIKSFLDGVRPDPNKQVRCGFRIPKNDKEQ